MYQMLIVFVLKVVNKVLHGLERAVQDMYIADQVQSHLLFAAKDLS